MKSRTQGVPPGLALLPRRRVRNPPAAGPTGGSNEEQGSADKLIPVILRSKTHWSTQAHLGFSSKVIVSQRCDPLAIDVREGKALGREFNSAGLDPVGGGHWPTTDGDSVVIGMPQIDTLTR